MAAEASPATKTTYRSCNLCEAICGLTIEHDTNQVVSIKGDKEDPLSHGHICPKAIALQDIYSDPDRLKQPMHRTDGGFKPISWDEAFDLVESKLTKIREQHGNDSVGFYLGNPTVHNSGAMLFQGYLKRALQTKNSFSATSVDQLPHHLAASQMFGHGLMIPIPDIDNTDFMLILGANPVASNGSLMSAPDVKNRLKAITKRGGQVILFDPRKTESASVASEHYFIRPGTDAFLLAAILNVLFSKRLTNLERLEAFTKNVDLLESAVAEMTPEHAAAITGVDAETIIQIAVDFSNAKQAVVYGRMGVSTQPHGGLCHWLINAINLVTGNLDRAGGQMFTTPAVSLVGVTGTGNEFGRWKSRVRGLPEFEGDLPVAVLAEEILTPGEGKIRAMITNAGNPVLSTPNGKQVDEAFAELDFYVALDIYINETTRHADLILPSPSGLETDHYDFVFFALAVRNVAKLSPQVFQPAKGSLYDWQIMRELAVRLQSPNQSLSQKIKSWFGKKLLKLVTPDRLLDLGLKLGPYGLFKKGFKSLSLKKLKANPHGIDLGPLKSTLPAALKTSDKQIDAAPKIFVDRIKEVVAEMIGQQEGPAADTSNLAGNEFRLIGRRHLRSNNSWMHNYARLVKGPNRCTLMMNSSDAERFELTADELVDVTTSTGSVTTNLEITDEIMPGVVSLPHGYGHHRNGTRIGIAEQHAGVSINDLTDDKIVDALTGNAAFSGQVVKVVKANQ